MGPPQTLDAPRWLCALCTTWSPHTQPHCVNPACRRPQHHRLFVGQLRKEGTASLLRWVCGMVVPSMVVSHVESHTNPREGHRGKGCAWIDVPNASDVAYALTLHGRCFVDEDNDGREGVWVTGTSVDAKKRLKGFAAWRAEGPRTRVLPRTCRRAPGASDDPTTPHGN